MWFVYTGGRPVWLLYPGGRPAKHTSQAHKTRKQEAQKPTAAFESVPATTEATGHKRDNTMDWGFGFYDWNPWIGRAEKSNKVRRQAKGLVIARIQKLSLIRSDLMTLWNEGRSPHATLTQRPLLFSSDLFPPTNRPSVSSSSPRMSLTKSVS